MSLLAKTLVVLNLILAVFFLGVSATVFTTSKNWVQESKKFDAEYQAKIKEFDGLLSSAREVRTTLEKDKVALQDENKRLDVVKNQLDNEVGDLKNAKAKLQEALDLANESGTQKDRYLEAKDTEIAQLSTRLNDAQVARTSAEEAKKNAEKLLSRTLLDSGELTKTLTQTSIELAQYREKSEELENLMARIRERVSIDDLIVKPVAPNIDGQVVAVSAVDSLIVLSVGSHDKVEEGHEFSISRGNNFIGKAQVSKVTDDMAGARILWLVDGQAPQVGDRVRTGTGQ